MTPKRIQDIDFQPSGADEAVDQFMPYYTPKGWIEAGRRVEAKNANRAQKMDDLVPEVGADAVGEPEHLGDFIGDDPRVHVHYDFARMARRRKAGMKHDDGRPSSAADKERRRRR